MKTEKNKETIIISSQPGLGKRYFRYENIQSLPRKKKKLYKKLAIKSLSTFFEQLNKKS